MIILPAIDLLDGKVVRLTQGRRDQVTVYSDDPLGMAHRWKTAGASWLHVVDLNGALDGTYTNLPLARRIIDEAGLQIELSGGIRTQEILQECLDGGASRVVLGTKACEDPEFLEEAIERHGRKIAVAIDARAGQVVSRGWLATTGLTAPALAKRVADMGVELLICTDVSRDGTMQGPNFALLTEVLEAARVPVIASGGISTLNDLRRLKTLEPQGVVGAITGKALYERAFTLDEALQAVSQDVD